MSSLTWHAKDRDNKGEWTQYRHAGQPLPNYDIEMMDLDLSLSSSHSPTSPNQPMDLGESYHSKQTSLSSQQHWKSKSYAIGSFDFHSRRSRSLTDSMDSDESPPQRDGIIRPKTASPIRQYHQTTPILRQRQHSAFDLGSFTSSSKPPCENSEIQLNRKRGYGIPDDNMFSHYPKYDSQKQKSVSRQQLNKKNSHEDKSIKASFRCCKILLIIILSLFLISLIISAFSIHPIFSIHFNFNRSALEKDFRINLYGQHLVTKIIPKILQQNVDTFISRQDKLFFHTKYSDNVGCTPLLLSFHGWTGVGKTFVSHLISHSFTNVNLYPVIIPLVFSHKLQSNVEANIMFSKVIDNLSVFKTNIFILDEMDKAPYGAVRGLTQVITHLTNECQSSSGNYRMYHVIFILLSVTHANKINEMLTHLMSKSGMSREKVVMSDFESIFMERDEWYNVLVNSKQIDAFVPFLPLEKRHTIQCIRRDLKSKGIPVTDDRINAVLRELRFLKFGDLEISSTGCKRVSDKVDLTSEISLKNRYQNVNL